MINLYILIFLTSVFIASVSQILLKISANKLHKNGLKEYLNLYVCTAYSLFFISTILTIFSLKGIPLSRAPVLESVGYVYIMLLSRMILNEKITLKKILGNLLIISGIFIFNL